MAVDQPRLVLASASPRRRELLACCGVPFALMANDAEERTDPVPAAVLAALPAYPLAPAGHPSLLAWRKAQAARDAGASGWVVGADTIVVVDATILGKPRDAAHAHQMLRTIAGRWHTVYTGMAVIGPDGAPLFDLSQSQVQIAPLSDAEIAEYVATGEPLDKAGSYGVQGRGGRLVQQVEGSFTTVVGLSLPATIRLLEQAGLKVPVTASEAWQCWQQTLPEGGLCIRPSQY
jgi:septum formation protein